MTERQTLTVDETARVLGIGRNLLYASIKRGEFPALRLGGRIVISRRTVDQLLEQGQLPNRGPKGGRSETLVE